MSGCAICGSEQISAAPPPLLLPGGRIDFCPNCGVGSTRALDGGYAGEDPANAARYALLNRLNIYFGRRTEFLRRYEQSFSLIRSVGSPASVLDVGCSIGYWLDFLGRKGLVCTGVEPDRSCRDFGRTVFALNIHETLQECRGKYDLISLSDVLEHIRNPLEFLQKISDLASPGALYFIQLPNCGSDMARRLGKNWPWWSVPDHLWHFSPAGLEVLLSKAGLKSVSSRTCDTMYDIVEHVLPGPMRPIFRPLSVYFRTSGYIYRRGGRGGLIQVVARKAGA